MIWFTSDLHLNHRAVVSMCQRPFENVDEMNDILIRNFNERVKKNDMILVCLKEFMISLRYQYMA